MNDSTTLSQKTTKKTKTTQKSKDVLEKAYDESPYQSFPFAHTHPTHLYTIAKLFGLQPTAVENARILELGCASGGNLIPVAYHFPQSECLGIDLSEVQIKDGSQQISGLKLQNISLRHQSILDFHLNEGKFDYIICHGVYSWVDDLAKDKILDICQKNLTENGIAYISYNTFPGWNMVNSVKDLMLWHTKNITDPKQKAQQARIILKFMTDGLQQDNSPYAACLRNEIQLLSRQPDSYLLHEHLSHYNQPIYFHQFMAEASKHQLSYLSDSNFEMMYTDNLPTQFANELKKITDIVAMGQYMDFIRNQRFRATLLCHASQKINRSLKTQDIEPFYLQLRANPTNGNLSEEDLKKEGEIQFSNGMLTYNVRHPLSKLAMLILYENKVKPIHYQELCKKIAERGAIKDMQVIKQNLNNELNLMRAVLAGIIQICSYPKQFHAQVDPQPIACPFARFQASQQKTAVTNRCHQPYGLSAVTAAILPHMDGTHSLSSLANIIIEQVHAGKMKVVDAQQQPITDEDKVREKVEAGIEQELNQLAHNALLVHTDRQC